MRLSLEKRILLTIVICSLIAAGIIAIIIIPSMKRIQELNAETNQLRDYLERKHERAVDLTIALKTLAKIGPEVDSFGTYLFFSGDELKLITTLEGIAAKNNVVQKINTSNLGKTNNDILTLSVTVSGSYASVIQYIQDLETIKYFVTIRHIQLVAATDPLTKKEVTSANLDLSLYASH